MRFTLRIQVHIAIGVQQRRYVHLEQRNLRVDVRQAHRRPMRREQFVQDFQWGVYRYVPFALHLRNHLRHKHQLFVGFNAAAVLGVLHNCDQPGSMPSDERALQLGFSNATLFDAVLGETFHRSDLRR